MIFAPYILKTKAIKALKGNWQTALLVSFFSGILAIASSLVMPRIDLSPIYIIYSNALSALSALSANDPTALSAYNSAMEDMQNTMLAAIRAIPISQWLPFIGLWLLAFLVTPVLRLGCNHYFVRRLKEEELGFTGLFSRMRFFGKALLLHLWMTVIILAWSLLFIIPGIVAAIRYSMAPYYLAEDPHLTVWEAMKKSKNAMRTAKMGYFVLLLSFIGWSLMPFMAQSLLGSNVILALVVGQFIELFVNTYMNGAKGAFFLAVSEPVPATIVGSPWGNPASSGFPAWPVWERSPRAEGSAKNDEDDGNDKDGKETCEDEGGEDARETEEESD